MRVEKYFSYQHLPEHLQAVSKPFSDCINDLTAQSIGDLQYDINKNKSISNDIEQTELAIHKLTQALNYFLGGSAILIIQQLILEAKDCAVRASIK